MKKLNTLIISSIILSTQFIGYGFAKIDSDYFKSLSQQEQNRIKLINNVNSGVISIIGKQKVLKYEYNLVEIGEGIYRKVPKGIAQEGEQIVTKGTGFFISKNGYIITNKHVVEDSKLIYEVITNAGEKHKVTNIYLSETADLALLKIQGNNYNALKLTKSDDIMIGQSIIAIGNSLGEYDNTVTMGIISGVDRDIIALNEDGTQEEIKGAIQIDASINLGNSGGPLLDSNGNVIGINTAIDTKGENIGFALPTNTILEFLVSTFKK